MQRVKYISRNENCTSERGASICTQHTCLGAKSNPRSAEKVCRDMHSTSFSFSLCNCKRKDRQLILQFCLLTRNYRAFSKYVSRSGSFAARFIKFFLRSPESSLKRFGKVNAENVSRDVLCGEERYVFYLTPGHNLHSVPHRIAPVDITVFAFSRLHLHFLTVSTLNALVLLIDFVLIIHLSKV